MPKGMFLKSEWDASNLSDPTGRNTLARYCAENGLPYGEKAGPIPLDLFTGYALSFRKGVVPAVEEVMIAGIEALGQRGIGRVGLVGWSFGDAVVISVGVAIDAAVGVATVAS